MNRLLCVLVFALTAVAGASAQSGQLPAYSALRTVGRERGESLLSTLVEMKGSDGNPQPARWMLSFKDVAARGGIREFVVTSSGIASERTPVAAQALVEPGTMAAAGLNLDSTGAFTAANKEADKIKLGFSSLDYRLQNRRGAPVWTVRLFDAGGIEVGMIEISAKDGSIVTPLRKAAVVESSTAAPSSPARNSSPSSNSGDLGERWVEGGGLVGHVSRWGEKTWQSTTNTAVRVGDSISAFFVGRPPRQPGADNR